MTPRVQTCVLEERSRKLTRPCCGNYSTTIPPVQAAWYCMRSRKRRSRLRSLSVTSIGCGKPGGSIAGKGGRAAWTVKKKGEPPGHLVRVTPSLSFVGVHVFEAWLQQQGGMSAVIPLLQQAIHTYRTQHPDDDFPLLHHREQTLRRRFQALFFAPLLGIETLTAFDTHEHPLQTLLGRGYHSATLTQFLGQLERIDAAGALLPALMPQQVGQIAYVDGHMIAYWSRVPMHKGKITMLGRIMAGSQAVITHDEAGQGLFVEYHPPDQHLSQFIVAYCQKVALATGLSVFVIDRAANSLALARAFDHQAFGLLCMLDDNEHHGLESFEATLEETRQDGTKVYSGPWKMPRADDPRHFVIVEPAEGKTLVYWGTPRVKAILEPTAWPQVYRERSEIQENSFKRMIDHGALNTNYGRKKIIGPDRHQQREQEKRGQALVAAQKRLEKKAEEVRAQQAKVVESEHKGHGKRLEQRQRALAVLEKESKDAQAQHTKLAAHASALGPPRERADRDFRKQTIMTIRTLLLENALTSFMAVLVGTLTMQVSLDCLLPLLFARSGARMETDSQMIYWISTTGVSAAYQRLLTAVVDGLCAMDWRDQGKPIRVRLKGLSP